MLLLETLQKAAELLLGTTDTPAKSKEEEPDPYTQIELQDQDKRDRELDLRGKKQNIEERKRYAKRIFVMLCFWLVVILIIVILSAVGQIPYTCLKFELSGAVLIALITTTTINIAGFFLAVTNHLFPSQEKK